jgi:hypothetical protein
VKPNCSDCIHNLFEYCTRTLGTQKGIKSEFGVSTFYLPLCTNERENAHHHDTCGQEGKYFEKYVDEIDI